MRLTVFGRSGLRGPLRGAVAALALAVIMPGGAARAQYYDDPGYDAGYRPVPRRAQRAPVGYNCDAIQQGITGPKPFSCPLPGPRPLGVRCFCDLPIASFSPPQTAVGHVVP